MTRSSFFLDDVLDYPVASGHFIRPDGIQVERPLASGILSAGCTGAVVTCGPGGAMWAHVLGADEAHVAAHDESRIVALINKAAS